MRLSLVLGMSLLLAPAVGLAADDAADPLGPWAPLLGRWTSDADPKMPGVTGGFSFERDVGGRVLVRRNHADYPAQKDRPAFHHEDLTVVFAESGKVRADYFDNEGHVIHYTVETGPSRIVCVGDVVAGAARYRFTYQWSRPGQVEILFEIAPPNAPDAFKPYIRASAHREEGK
jgi:hypothetical protein